LAPKSRAQTKYTPRNSAFRNKKILSDGSRFSNSLSSSLVTVYLLPTATTNTKHIGAVHFIREAQRITHLWMINSKNCHRMEVSDADNEQAVKAAE
jgi:hypothetical protein